MINNQNIIQDLFIKKSENKVTISDDFFIKYSNSPLSNVMVKYEPKIGVVLYKTELQYIKTFILNANYKFKYQLVAYDIDKSLLETKIKSLNNNIKDVYLSNNLLIIEPFGYMEILKNSQLSLLLQVNNNKIGYFTDGNIEKICVIYSNCIRIYESKNMSKYVLGTDFSFYNFLEIYQLI